MDLERLRSKMDLYNKIPHLKLYETLHSQFQELSQTTFQSWMESSNIVWLGISTERFSFDHSILDSTNILFEGRYIKSEASVLWKHSSKFDYVPIINGGLERYIIFSKDVWGIVSKVPHPKPLDKSIAFDLANKGIAGFEWIRPSISSDLEKKYVSIAKLIHGIQSVKGFMDFEGSKLIFQGQIFHEFLKHAKDTEKFLLLLHVKGLDLELVENTLHWKYSPTLFLEPI